MSYLFRRFFGLSGLLVGISLVTFFVIHLAPGDPATLKTELNPKASLQARVKMMELYGLDRPLHEQYVSWVSRMVRMDFGSSFKDGESVLRKIQKRIPLTLFINLAAMALVLVFGIALGIAGAVRPNSALDQVLTVFVYVGFAIPTFWLSLVLMSFFGVKLGWLPVAGIVSLEFEDMGFLEKALDIARHLVLPVSVSAFTGIAGISRYARESLIETLRQDYIKTAWAKGLSARRVILKHALRNALLPIVTLLGLSLPGLLGGSVIFESIFSLPGMGRLFFDSVAARDYPVVMGVLMIGAMLTLLGNLAADLTYFWVDPRIRVEARR